MATSTSTQQLGQPLIDALQDKLHSGQDIGNKNIKALAQTAHRLEDAEITKALHSMKNSTGHTRATHNERHSTNSKEWLKISVFGGLDGIVTIFCVVAGCAGASLSTSQIMVIALGNLIGDAVSMGYGEYVSSTAEDEYERQETQREAWEMHHCPEDEQLEMIELYQEKWGMTEKDACDLVSVSWKYPEFFLNHMMCEELEILLHPGGMSSAQKGLLMASSFFIFGAVPLVTYGAHSVISPLSTFISPFLFSCISAAFALFILGTVKSHLILEGFGYKRCLKDGLFMFLNGTFAGTIAYLCGTLLERFIQNHSF